MDSTKFFAIAARNGNQIDDQTRAKILHAPVTALLTIGNPKTLKGEKKGYRTAILHLAPSTSSGVNVCPSATAGCAAACLNTAGRGGFDPKIPAARKLRTYWFLTRRDEFMTRLAREISNHVKQCAKDGYIPAIRLNGTSDIRWETIPVGGFDNVMSMFPNVRFYDYTKIPNRRGLPANYTLTLSVHEGTPAATISATVAAGNNVAMVLRSDAIMARSTSPKGQGILMRKMILPDTVDGIPVVDGDESDLRFLDPRGVIVGLRAKGRAVLDTTGFVRTVA